MVLPLRCVTFSAMLIFGMVACGGSGGSSSGSSSSGSSSSGSSGNSSSSNNVSSTASTSSGVSSQASSHSSEPVDSGLSGLDARPANASCLAGAAPDTAAQVSLVRVFASLSFASPVAMLQSPGDTRHWYVVEKAGRIRVFDKNAPAETLRTFADVRQRVNDSSGESGLLSMAFHPDYANNGEVYLYHQVSEPGTDNCCVSQLVRYRTNDNRTSLEADSAEVLLSFPAPYASKNHFGGRLGFGRDGFLYLSIGDGGSAGDPDNRAQNTANLWGSMVRLDVNTATSYTIPAANPYSEQSGFLCNTAVQMTAKQAAGGQCPELYAWGLRNPWRWSFDRDTGDLWLADVGQGRWEEINLIARGGNYGWRIREGNHCYNPANNCTSAGLIAPVAEISQPEFQSITGGYRYRGEAITPLHGRYVFGDFVTGALYSLVPDDAGGWQVEPLITNTGHGIASFAEDAAGELYLVSFSGGLYQLVDASSQSVNAPEQWLSDTGCVNPAAPHEPASGLIPYQPRAPFWSDGASKVRWFALPDNTQISVADDQDWQLPEGSVLLKHFYLNNRLIETRLFKHHSENSWAGYTYAWNDSGTDAELVAGGREEIREGQPWIFPSEAGCLQCHTEAAGRSLGLETQQLNHSITYASTGRTANQLDTLKAIGVLTSEADATEVLADPADESASLDNRARAYLHTNCSQCHRPGGTTNVAMDLRVGPSLSAMNICNVPAQNGSGESPDARRLVPGNASESLLITRMALRDHANEMPPVGSNLVDELGVALLREWINGLSVDACN